MSAVSSDECYSNVDNLEELRHICGKQDATISKLKLLLIRKNKTIASLEKEVSCLKTTTHITKEQAGVKTNVVEVMSGGQQANLEKSKIEVETLSKMVNELQRSITVIKQERDTFKSEVSRLMSDLVTANARTTELYAIASKFSPSPADSHNHPHNQHSFILATLKNLVEDKGKENSSSPMLTVLQSIQREVGRLQGINGADRLVVSSTEELQILLEQFSTYLRHCSPDQLRLSLRVHKDKIKSHLTNISHSRDEVKLLLKEFTQTFNSSSQLLLSTINNFRSCPLRFIKADQLHREFSVLKGELGFMKDAIVLQMSSFVESTSLLRNQITSTFGGESVPVRVHHSSAVNATLNSSKIESALSVVSFLRNDLSEAKTAVCQWLTSLQVQIHDVKLLQEKLLSKITHQSSPPPPYSECISPLNSTTLEALLTDIWQLKDSLSGVKCSLTEGILNLKNQAKGVELMRRKLMRQLYCKFTNLQSDVTDIRREMHQLVSLNHQFAAISICVHSIEKTRLKSFDGIQRQHFEDYDRLVRDKESEVDQLRESYDRLSDECIRFNAMREALRQLIFASTTSSKCLGELSDEDVSLITNLSNRLNCSQATQLELVEQTQAIASLQSDLAAKTIALNEAIARTTEAEKKAAESAAETSGLLEKLNLVKRLLVRVRRDASETEKRAVRVAEMEAKVTDLTLALDESQRNGEAVQAKLTEVMEERERLVGKVALLQKQYDSYKVKALLALRNGKDHPQNGNSGSDSSTSTGTEGIGSGSFGTPLSWRYECSSLAQAEVARLKERVRELEASLGQTTARLNSASIDLEAANFALAEEKEKCSCMIHNLESEHAQWRKEREESNARHRSEAAARVAELTTALDEARQEGIRALSAQAEEFNTAFSAKITELQIQLDAAEAKVESQRLELLEQRKMTQLAAQPLDSQASRELLCSRCGQRFSNLTGTDTGSDNNTLPRAHRIRPLEEALFEDEETDMADIQEVERQTSEMRKTIQSLRSQLLNERRNLEYTKSLLVDSEATVERLSTQATILKAEIRRQDRNAERERHLSDQNTASDHASDDQNAVPIGVTRAEYLKNVLLRFLSIDPSLGGGGVNSASERNALVPVLTTLLALSPTERAALQQVADSGTLRTSTVTSGGVVLGEEGSSWSSLLPSWLGG
ncbi:unnamed protein product [Hydatigera taeniaeformis]|uniref:GRIP domain-containing protein n=1 Tax=Hydatigena taeniaeformis TaxID=6205 RepID=A0A158RE21_HYDTA|nr:unnamed protein product [Hydatigera taeniaeformis]